MNKTALVTGGNSGIGYATAKLLKELGYAVTISGRDAQRISNAAKTLGVTGVVADMGIPHQVQQLINYYANQPLHCLVNNAAIARFIPVELNTAADFDEMFNINVRGPLALIAGLLPALKLTQGSITNVTSAVVNNGLANASLYAATKGALVAATKSLALEFAPYKIRVNAVSPGAIDTPISGKLGLDENTRKAIRAHLEQTIPLKRYGAAEEVAHCIVAQLESTYTTGAVWDIDGGVGAR